MKNAKAIAFGICTVLLMAMAGAGIAMAAGENAAVSDGLVGDSTYSFSIGPGGSYSEYPALYAGAPSDYDTWVMTVTSTCTVTVTVADLYIMGDTIALKAGGTVLSATSPEAISVSRTLPAGTYTFYTGYLDSPGGYPAGYGVSVTAA